MKKLSRLQFTLLAVLACLLWSTAFSAIKIGMQYNETPIFFAGQRFMLAGILILPFTGSLTKVISLFREHILLIAKVGFLQTFMLYLFFYLGLDRIPGAVGAVIVGASPLAAAVWAHFLMPNDKLNLHKIISFILGIAGICCMAFAKHGDSSESYPQLYWGIGFMLTSVLSSSFAGVYIAKEKKGIPPLILNASQLFMGGVFLTIAALFIEKGPKVGEIVPYVSVLVYLASVSAIAFSIWFLLLKQPDVKISYLNIWKFIMPVFGAIFSWGLLKNEHPTFQSIMGVTLVGLAIIVFNISIKQEKTT